MGLVRSCLLILLFVTKNSLFSGKGLHSFEDEILEPVSNIHKVDLHQYCHDQNA